MEMDATNIASKRLDSYATQQVNAQKYVEMVLPTLMPVTMGIMILGMDVHLLAQLNLVISVYLMKIKQ